VSRVAALVSIVRSPWNSAWPSSKTWPNACHNPPSATREDASNGIPLSNRLEIHSYAPYGTTGRPCSVVIQVIAVGRIHLCLAENGCL
jgi:hypothetical protein